MKILLSVLHFGLLRNFESVVRLAAERGHRIHLLADEPDLLVGGQALAEALAAEYPQHVTWGTAPSYAGERWFAVARRIRPGIDYLRFLGRQFKPYEKLRRRAVERAPLGVQWALRVPLVNTPPGRWLLRTGLEAVDRAMPRNPAMDAWLAAERPDVMLLASVTNPRAPQLDHLRSARALGIPTGVCVYSWDHLSSKALIRVWPDRMFVWNETQQEEAITLHGVPADRIVITGAQCYDQWFEWTPSRSREVFCHAWGLPPDRTYIYYLCSTFTPDPGEAWFVRRWIEHLRQSADPRLREAAVLIRPHPERRAEWETADLSGLGPVVVQGKALLTAAGKADYFDSLHYSAAVVGLVTSAFLEAAIVGRPVLTILDPAYRIHQEGMRHFRYLLEVEGGLLQVARGFEEHLGQLAAVLDEDGAYRVQQQRFLKAFVRPQSLAAPATPLFLDAVETLARERPAPMSDASSAWMARLVASLVHRSDRTPWLQLLMDDRDFAEYRERMRLLAADRKKKAETRHAKALAKAERRKARAEQRRLKERAEQQRQREKERAKRQRMKDKRHFQGSAGSD